MYGIFTCLQRKISICLCCLRLKTCISLSVWTPPFCFAKQTKMSQECASSHKNKNKKATCMHLFLKKQNICESKDLAHLSQRFRLSYSVEGGLKICSNGHDSLIMMATMPV